MTDTAARPEPPESTGQETVVLLGDLNTKLGQYVDIAAQNGIQVLDALARIEQAQEANAAAIQALASAVQGIATTEAAELADLAQLVADEAPPPQPQAVTGRVSQQGEPNMALTVDAAGVAHYQSEDDHGDLVATPTGDGSGITVTFSSDNPAVVSGYAAGVLGQDANGVDEWTAAPTVVADGSFNLSAVVANTSDPTGANLLDNDGTTPFKQPTAVPVTLAGGQATTGVVSES